MNHRSIIPFIIAGFFTIILTLNSCSGSVEYKDAGIIADGTTGDTFSDQTMNKPDIPPIKGLVAHWKLDEKSGTIAKDSSGNNHHGSLVNSPTWAAGKIGGALSFDGLDDYVNISTHPVSSGPFTIALWAKRTGSGSGSKNPLIRANTPGGSDGYAFFWHNTTELHFLACTSTSKLQPEKIGLPNNVWVHVAATYDGSIAKIYADGKLLDSKSGGGALNKPQFTLRLGGQGGGVDKAYFKGLLDDVQIYSKALSATEISNLSSGSTPSTCSGVTCSGFGTCAVVDGKPKCNCNSGYYAYGLSCWKNDPNLLAWWHLDETTGTTAKDATTNGHDGTIDTVKLGVKGVWGTGFEFKNGRVKINKLGKLNITKAITISAWIKPTSLPGVGANKKDHHFIVNRHGASDFYRLSMKNTGDTMMVLESSMPISSFPKFSSSKLALSKWNHVAATYDGATTKIYLNGVLENQNAIKAAIKGSTSGWVELGNNDVKGRGYEGAMDEVRLFDRALNATEVKNEYEALCKSGSCITP